MLKLKSQKYEKLFNVNISIKLDFKKISIPGTEKMKVCKYDYDEGSVATATSFEYLISASLYIMRGLIYYLT